MFENSAFNIFIYFYAKVILKNPRRHLVQKIRRTKQQTLKYVHIRVNGNNIQSKKTKIEVPK